MFSLRLVWKIQDPFVVLAHDYPGWLAFLHHIPILLLYLAHVYYVTRLITAYALCQIIFR